MPSRATTPKLHTTLPLVSHFMELLESAGPVRHRRMFGGWGFYVDGLFAALVSEETLYLKVNEQTRAQFQAAGGEPFTYASRQQTVQVDYYTPPAQALDSPALMRPWVLLAMQAALAARARKLPTGHMTGHMTGRMTGRRAPAAKGRPTKGP